MSTSVPELGKQLQEKISESSALEIEIHKLEEEIENVLLKGIENPTEASRLDELEKREIELEDNFVQKRKEILELKHKFRRNVLQNQIEAKDKLKELVNTLSSSLFSPTMNKNFLVDSEGKLIQIMQDGQYVKGDEEISINQWQIEPKELKYEKSDKLGSGTFGDVFKGTLRGKEVAIKKLTFQFDENTLNEFKKEVVLMAKLRHPNVLLFMGACTTPGKLAVVCELMPKGSVYDLLHNREEKLSLNTRILFAKDAVLGMNWLHCSNPPFLHLDLKTQNLLVDAKWTVKVADFGLSRVKSCSSEKGKIGSPIYMAPEILLEKDYDEKADVYSFGIVLWELFTQQIPYADQPFKSLDDLINSVTKKGLRPNIPQNCPSALTNLITQCWNPSVDIRPSFESIIKSKTFDEILVDVSISEVNSFARSLWKKRFLQRDQVPYDEFLKALTEEGKYRIGDPEDIQIQCFKSLLVKKINDKEYITLEHFGKVLEWIGPLSPGQFIFEPFESILKLKGFFGFIEATEAEQRLNNAKVGSYLIRFSSRDPGCFAITVLSKEKLLKHFRVTHKAGLKYQVANSEYDSLKNLIKAHEKDLYLKNPLGGSVYESMFIAWEKKISSIGYG